MKKLMLALLAVVVVAAAALMAFWPQVRLWQMQQALDRLLIPALKAQYLATYGREPAVSYQGLKADGGAYLAQDFSLSLPGQPELLLKIKQMRLDKVDISLWGDLKTCDALLSDITMEVKGLEMGDQNLAFNAALAKVEVEGLSIGESGRRIRLARKSAHDLRVTNSAVKVPFQITLIEARDYDFSAGPQWKSSQGSLGLLTLKSDAGVAVELKGLTFSSDTPTWVKGMPYFDQAKIQTRQVNLMLPVVPGPEPALSVAQLAMTLSRKPQRSADRVEIKGLTWREQPDDKLRQAFRELGYQNPSLDLTYDYVYDQAAKTFDCAEFTLGVEQAGRFSFSFLLNNVEADLASDPANQLEALKKARPARLTMRYEDASLADRLLGLGAKKEAMELEAFRAKLLAELPPLPGSVQPEPALLNFIRQPSKLCLSVKPRQELSVEQYGELGPALQAVLEWKLDNCP